MKNGRIEKVMEAEQALADPMAGEIFF